MEDELKDQEPVYRQQVLEAWLQLLHQAANNIRKQAVSEFAKDVPLPPSSIPLGTAYQPREVPAVMKKGGKKGASKA